MSKTTRRRGGREEFWRQLIRDHLQSVTSIKQFCQSRGVSEASYFAWRKELAVTKQSNLDDFVAVRLISDAAASACSVEIVLDFAGGCELNRDSTGSCCAMSWPSWRSDRAEYRSVRRGMSLYSTHRHAARL